MVIPDNLATHRNAEAAKAMRRAGCWFLFLPPYSPELNPIEMAFSKLKAHLRAIGARTFTDMFNATAEICDLYSPDECWNYFKAAGYVSSAAATPTHEGRNQGRDAATIGPPKLFFHSALQN